MNLHKTLDILVQKKDKPLSQLTQSTSPGLHRGVNIYKDLNDVTISNAVTSIPSSAVLAFLQDCLHAMETVHGDAYASIKLIIPNKNGYIIRSDFLESRMNGCKHLRKVVGFIPPLQAIHSYQSDAREPCDLAKLASSAVGGILMDTSVETSQNILQTRLESLEAELENRLSFPWMLSNPIAHKRLALLGGRVDIEVSRRIYEAAIALGINLVVLDVPGHWLEDEKGPFTCLREAFIPIDMTTDSTFPQRVADVLHHYSRPFDGIMATMDVFLVSMSKAAKILGLPTTPTEAYERSCDKFKTRTLETNNKQAFQVSSVTDLRQRLESGRFPPLSYPLIVKPCLGWASDCVSKVSNEVELYQAVAKASARHGTGPLQKPEVLIDAYIDGPEVDANFVLWEGEILFYEISDDFPCPGDKEEATSKANFLETQVVLPSRLPVKEIELIKMSMQNSILRQGFRSGVIHCEARVLHSSVHYEKDESGTLDLVPLSERPAHEPDVHLIEINARTPAYQSTVATLFAYGVDYYAQQMLISVGDEVRLRALSIPFLRGHQYDCMFMYIHPERAGIMKSVDPVLDLRQRCAELMSYVPEEKAFVRKGDQVRGPDSSELSFLATFLVVSPTGRRDLLRLGEEIRMQFAYELE